MRSIEDKVPADHPIRRMREMVDVVLIEMDSLFENMYSDGGRSSVPPERLLRAMLLQYLYTIRSERQLMEHLEYNVLFRWFVGLDLDDKVWTATVFTKNRDRFLDGDVAKEFFNRVVRICEEANLVSNVHFTTDGTLIEAWASHKSFQPKKDKKDDQGKSDKKDKKDKKDPPSSKNPDVDFRGEKRSNETHESTTDPDARLYKKSANTGAVLCLMGHILTENRNGLVVNASMTHATGTAEREASEKMLRELKPTKVRRTLGADKAYDTKDFVARLRKLNVTPHVSQNNTGNRSSAIDARTTNSAGYDISQTKRKKVEQVWGWLKTVGGLRKTRHKGIPRNNWILTLATAAYDLVRLRNIFSLAWIATQPIRAKPGAAKGWIQPGTGMPIA
jgi:transposase